ncbi:hypothetical protein J7E96_31325 [Streptomyces sp. ISL-96]|uniref:hypothetical protein n=1 Tax=Streptomyces sp. ISL-96 TaxID=2819191 RepID=UPI001BE69887|nr:hypothetical protein [Streptomyces sp. ISL-96]MBT2492922.1 hypothetical protein [Streptomyces sp. ISL-96]
MSEEKAPFEIIDVSEVKPEDAGTLSLRYVDGTPVLVVSGGTAIPTNLAVANAEGALVASYAISPVAAGEPAIQTKQNAFQLGTDWAITDPLNTLHAVQHANTEADGS